MDHVFLRINVSALDADDLTLFDVSSYDDQRWCCDIVVDDDVMQSAN